MKNKSFFLFGIVVASFLSVSGCGSDNDKIRYVAIGASDATGVGASPITNGYVFLIDDSLDDNCGGAELFNLGIPGVEADQIEDTELPVALELEPDVVTIFVGGNDIVGGRSVQSFQMNVAEILSSLMMETEALVYIADLPDLTQIPRFRSEPDPDVTIERLNAFNQVIRSEAQASGATLITLSDNSFTDVDVSDDGFHPSDEGHRVIADEFLAQIVPALCG